MRVFDQSAGWLAGQRARSAFTLVDVVVAVGIVGLVTAIAIPNIARSREKAWRDLCIHNLQRIEIAKTTWGLEQGKGPEDVPEELDLGPQFQNDRFPSCPGGGVYVIGSLSEAPTCSRESQGHVLESPTPTTSITSTTVTEPTTVNSSGNGNGNHTGTGNGGGNGNGNGNGIGQGNGNAYGHANNGKQ